MASCSQATSGDEDNCPLCLGHYDDPRALPCLHTYCRNCIQNLVDRNPGRRFNCPTCRNRTKLPHGGVQNLPKNFYINRAKRQKVEKDRDPSRCKTHKDEVLKFYCVPCEKVMCTDCKLTAHEGHETQDLRTAAEGFYEQLQSHKDRIHLAVQAEVDKTEAIKSQKREVQDKLSEAEKTIHDRHTKLIALAGKMRDEALESVRCQGDSVVKNIDDTLNKAKGNLEQLLSLQNQVDSVTSTSAGSDVVTVAKEMKNGRGSVENIKQLTSVSLPPSVSGTVPVLQYQAPQNLIAQGMHLFFGSAMTSKIADAEVTVVEKYSSGGPGTKVFSLCHVDTDPPEVWISYEQYEGRQNVRYKVFHEGGNFVRYGLSHKKGKRSLVRCAEGEGEADISSETLFSTFAKSLTSAQHRLTNFFDGTAHVANRTRLEFILKVGKHRAVDVDNTGQKFIVVEEPRSHEVRRKVLMYRRPAGDVRAYYGVGPVSTYSSPFPDSNPSDVCFCTVGFQQVLLISDEAKGIHVVGVRENKLVFMRLLSDSPSLVGVTAMNVDVHGRLWVACKDGKIVTIQPKV